MADQRTGPLTGRLLCWLAALALALAIAVPVSSVAIGPAFAQEQQRGGLLRLLFGTNDSQTRVREAPPPAARPAVRQQRRATQTRRQAAPRAAARARSPAPAPAAAAPADKAEDARKVLVVGDFVAGGLGEGLEAAFAEAADIVVRTRANGSSGLVRQDYFDWPAHIGEYVEAEEPDVVVVMIGANDRQQMNVAGRSEEPRSDAWTEEYERRVTLIADAVVESGARLIWVGMVPFRFRTMSSDMLAFNDLYRRVTENVGGEYVDVWDGFVDEEGEFAYRGPDMNGQPAQLRAEDGINITRAGKRKIAFYVEKPLERALGDRRAPDMDGLVTFGPRLPTELDGESSVPATERTQPVSLNDPALFGGDELLGGRALPIGTGARSAGHRLLDEASGAEARPGRADNFSPRRSADPRAEQPLAASHPALP